MLLQHFANVQLRPLTTCILPTNLPVLAFYATTYRYASLTSAIGRGIRRSQNYKTQNRRETEDRSKTELPKSNTPAWGGRGKQRLKDVSARLAKGDYHEGWEHRDGTRADRSQTRPRQGLESQPRGLADALKSREKSDKSRNRKESSSSPPVSEGDPPRPTIRRKSTVPLSIPYTTPASEFLYGRFCVEAALRSERRKLYKLYMLEREHGEDAAHDRTISKLALACNVNIVKVRADWAPMLNKMSESRPHNGYVLEASPLPKLPVKHLSETDMGGEVRLALDYQSEEEEVVNGRKSSFSNQSPGKAFPLVLMLDRILDPGNLGAIIRSAAFLGVSAIVLIEYGTAPLSAVALKASGGSAEHMPLLMTRNPTDFIKQSQNCGWHFYAAASAESISTYDRRSQSTSSNPIASALKDHATVLILGEEGSGVQHRHQKLADSLLGIERIGGIEFGLESLNVSVAAALLCDRFMRGYNGPDKLSLPRSNGRIF